MVSGEFGEPWWPGTLVPAKSGVAGGKLPFGHATSENGEVLILGFRFLQLKP